MLTVDGIFSEYFISVFLWNESKALGEKRRFVTSEGSSLVVASLHWNPDKTVSRIISLRLCMGNFSLNDDFVTVASTEVSSTNRLDEIVHFAGTRLQVEEGAIKCCRVAGEIESETDFAD